MGCDRILDGAATLRRDQIAGVRPSIDPDRDPIRTRESALECGV
jgi:hypothetical protein